MVISINSHGRKSDKETQSPVLNIFKEIMQRENDPAQDNLLKVKHDERKKKQLGSTRTKSDHKSNGSEKYKRTTPYKTYVEQRNLDHHPSRDTHSIPFQNEKRDSWWFWGESENMDKKEDTCSRVSCAFRRLLTSEYACMGCLLILFLTSVVLAFLLVFKNIPCLNTSEGLTSPASPDSEALKRKLEKLKDKRFNYYRSGEDFVGMKDLGDRSEWDDTMSKEPEGLSGLADFSNFHDMGFDDSKFSSDISNILYSDKLTDEQSSERLKNFYKKLIQTDAQIRNLKKGITNLHIPSFDDDFLKITDRVKRSAKRRPKHTFHFNNKDKQDTHPRTKPDGIVRKKRFSNGTDEPTGVLIEERKVIVQYLPDNRAEGKKKVPKCSHVPKESKSHEKQLKHPFYKNTQRLDELLDQFLAKNLPDDLPLNAYELDSLFQNKKNACKHPKVEEKDKEPGGKEIDDSKDNTAEDSSVKPEVSKELVHRGADDKRAEPGSTNSYGVLLSISTLLNTRKLVTPSDFVERPPRRKLMQVEEEDEENLGYEDLTEVLADDADSKDDTERQGERKKRKDEQSPNQIPNPVKYNPPGVHNPNWKGPMPLYPDELNSMIKQAAMNANKIQVPHSKNESPESEVEEREMNDMEYIEDYLNNKYERLVKMAQAYSDYGVLDEKKESATNANTHVGKEGEKRVKLAAEKKRLFNKGIFNRWKKASTDNGFSERRRTTISLQTGLPKREGIRFEMRPTSNEREDDPVQVFKLLSKHVKISPKDDIADMLAGQHVTTLLTPDLDLYKTSKVDSLEKSTDHDDEKGVIFKIGRGKRSLLSIDLLDGRPVEGLFEITSTPNLDSIDVDFKVSDEKVNRTDDIGTDDDKFDINNNTILGNSNDEGVIKENAINIANETNQNMGLSDFFMVLSDWFSFLDKIDNNGKINVSNSSSTPSETVTKFNDSAEVVYPIYDSDMIENIGHRSRVLLSIEDKEANTTDEKKDTNDVHVGTVVETVDLLADGTPTNLTNITGVTVFAKPPENAINKQKELKNRTIVKRNAEDSSLIFWNDIYDDEYGVKIDPVENTLRDKHSIKDRDLLKKPKLWIQEKFKKLKAKLGKDKVVKKKPAKTRPVHEPRNPGAETHQKDLPKRPSRLCKRQTVTTDDLDPNRNIDFTHLTAKMKYVCKKAARAVQQTRNIEVREDVKEGSMATSLMQQLVRLMTDLVDYQVQQKTCLKLPPDLSNFLEWLTSSGPDQQMSDSFKTSQHYDDVSDIISMGMDDDIPTSSEKESRPETRSECLGTLKAVQELIHEYDAMGDEDKSKMTGVREYLESQLEFLNRQLAAVEDYNITDKRHLPHRYKRDVSKKSQNKRKNQGKRRTRRKLQKFVKNFGKKHTRTTASYYENLQVTDLAKNDKNEAKTNEGKDQNSVKAKRNLRDVYYKAVADSKKITTLKDFNKKLDIND